jgi:8-oxo-dGTP diphosphatase
MASTQRFTLRCAVYLMPLRGDKILLARRLNTGWMDGMYSLIAGHINGNESITDAMVREAYEEARIKVEKEDLKEATVLHRKSGDLEYIDFFFAIRKWEGEPEIGEPDKCDEMEWYPVKNLPEKTLPYIKEALDSYINKVPFSESGWR